MGYDEFFYSVLSRPVVFTSHTSVPISCTPVEASPSFIHKVWGILAESAGDKVYTYRETSVYCFAHKPGYSFIGVNKAERDVQFIHEFTDVTGSQFATEKQKTTVKIPAKSSMLLNSAMGAESATSFGFAYNVDTIY
jgi:hypothetical protein